MFIELLLKDPLVLFSFLVALVIAISVHEFAHAFAADKLGDSTPAYQGRLTLNPLAHLDLFGTLFILLGGFGWGKPVQFNPWNLKHPKRDAAIISLAGPISNFMTAVLFAVLFRFLPPPGNYFLEPIVLLSLNLGLFNLVPVSPLDGFKIIGGVLPKSLYYQWQTLERYGLYILLLLIVPIFGDSILGSMLLPIIRIFKNLLLEMPIAIF